ncbi:hypothetical protein INT80_07065 [Gallibacterium anatis]|uniref:Uncharacterized protein n=1 Tax=Gallibacterium anatis TaxID=750 RepID=A0A930UUU7_9PAST|nr:hypothetical protein [Gallibacterium anatis]
MTFGDSIGGYSSMLMGNGADTVVVNGNAEFGSDSYYDNWLNEVFAKTWKKVKQMLCTKVFMKQNLNKK